MAALIPIRKSPAWWALPQDERRAIFEQRSHHIADSMAFLPRIARRLYHARDLGQPFDFITWFEFAPEHAGAFDELVAMLRGARGMDATSTARSTSACRGDGQRTEPGWRRWHVTRDQRNRSLISNGFGSTPAASMSSPRSCTFSAAVATTIGDGRARSGRGTRARTASRS